MADSHPLQYTYNDNAARKVREAIAILQQLDFPRAQINDRSALTLLALLDLKPNMSWANAGQPLMGIRPIMDWSRDHYGVVYAENSRETFRRQTIHQFVNASLAVRNPDDPTRATNSPKTCYQIEPKALALLQSFGTQAWEKNLSAYKTEREGLRVRYARNRELSRVPVKLSEDRELYLTSGEHNTLIKAIIEEFGPRFVPGGEVIYIGDTGSKRDHLDIPRLEELGVRVDSHGKMPDVVMYLPSKSWLILVEAVTSHGPVDGKRHEELAQLFSTTTAGLVYVTAFPSRSRMARYLADISWETEVWVADAPDHLIHFDGERFLGPYDSASP